MARCIVLAVAVMTAFALPALDPPGVKAGGSCSGHTSRTVPPKRIRVFRIHRRGSDIPARIETWDFKRYVGTVMASGAWPGRPRESAKVGAIAIKQYAWWMVLHHQRGYSFRGKCYDIRDGDQYIRAGKRPDSRVPARTARAVRATWHVSLRKHGRFFRTGWTGGGGGCSTRGDGWRLSEDAVRDCAHGGMGWRRILLRFLDPGLRIVA